MKYVIIGNGVASIGAIEGIRKYDKDGEILVISREDKATYGRPLISYYLAGKVQPAAMALRPESFYTDNKVKTLLGVTVTGIDTAKKSLTASSGETIAYDKLLLATGGEPNVPPLEGLDGPGIYTFTTWADADALKAELGASKKFVVLGAGLIALKAAEALAMAGEETTIVVRSRIMRVYFDEDAGELIIRHLESKGLKFAKGATPAKVVRTDDGVITSVETDKGLIPADVVIVATGVSPAKELAELAAIDVEKGILVDETMQTSAKGVYAAGDACEGLDMLSGTRRVTPIWPNAYNQGLTAGVNMTGENKPTPGGLSMNSITFFGMGTVSIGLTNPPEEAGFEISTFVDENSMIYRKLVFKDDTLQGCILIGDLDRAGIYNSFIKNRLPLDQEAKQAIIDGTPSPLFWPSDHLEAEMRRVTATS